MRETIPTPSGKYPKIQSCSCPDTVLEIGKAGVAPPVGEGGVYLRYWLFCPKCESVVQEWNTREDAARAEHHFVTMLMRARLEFWEAQDAAEKLTK